VQALLAKHARELSTFSEENSLPDVRFGSPTTLEALYGRDSPLFLSAKRIGTVGVRKQTASSPVLEQRRRMIARHKSEILTMNAECGRTVSELETMRDVELARKRMAIQAFRNDPIESERKQRIVEPVRAGRVIRLSLKVLKP
jgi:hypothetical protein